MNSSLYMIGYPGLSLQQSDRRWAKIAEYIFFLNEIDHHDDRIIGFFDDEVFQYYMDETRYAIYVYSRSSLIKQLEEGKGIIKLQLNRFLSPFINAKKETADHDFSHVCEEMGLNLIHLHNITIELPVVSSHQHNLIDVNMPVSDSCNICLDTSFQPWVQLSCAHKFHQSCITTWLQRALTCPICRSRPNMPDMTVYQ